MNQDDIAQAFRSACLLELQALKPGNVHRHRDGHGMSIQDFELSAEAAAPWIAESRASVGIRILRSVQATAAVVNRNTNLGIILLAAPLASAAENRGVPLTTALAEVLDSLTVEDADLAFAAIRLANPGGLGTVGTNDVHQPARVTLLQAMRQASCRDLIARQYATCFRDVFDLGLPVVQKKVPAGNLDPWVVTSLYLTFLATLPDTHIARKYGQAAAHMVRERTRSLLARTQLGPVAEPKLLSFDAELKAEGLNPGATADLTVASLFAAALVDRP